MVGDYRNLLNRIAEVIHLNDWEYGKPACFGDSKRTSVSMNMFPCRNDDLNLISVLVVSMNDNYHRTSTCNKQH